MSSGAKSINNLKKICIKSDKERKDILIKESIIPQSIFRTALNEPFFSYPINERNSHSIVSKDLPNGKSNRTLFQFSNFFYNYI